MFGAVAPMGDQAPTCGDLVGSYTCSAPLTALGVYPRSEHAADVVAETPSVAPAPLETRRPQFQTASGNTIIGKTADTGGARWPTQSRATSPAASTRAPSPAATPATSSTANSKLPAPPPASYDKLLQCMQLEELEHELSKEQQEFLRRQEARSEAERRRLQEVVEERLGRWRHEADSLMMQFEQLRGSVRSYERRGAELAGAPASTEADEKVSALRAELGSALGLLREEMAASERRQRESMEAHVSKQLSQLREHAEHQFAQASEAANWAVRELGGVREELGSNRALDTQLPQLRRQMAQFSESSSWLRSQVDALREELGSTRVQQQRWLADHTADFRDELMAAQQRQVKKAHEELRVAVQAFEAHSAALDSRVGACHSGLSQVNDFFSAAVAKLSSDVAHLSQGLGAVEAATNALDAAERHGKIPSRSKSLGAPAAATKSPRSLLMKDHAVGIPQLAAGLIDIGFRNGRGDGAASLRNTAQCPPSLAPCAGEART